MTGGSARQQEGEVTVAQPATPVPPEANPTKRQTGAKMKQSNNPTLPPEVLELILDNVQDASTMGKVARTCKKFHSIMTPRLHRRVATTTGRINSDVQLSHAVVLIQRYLSVKQNRKLRARCHCDGQREGFPYGSDLAANPPCAAYVREMIIGPISPRKNREYIVYLYLEQALKNMHGLEIVELWKITTSMAQSIAGLENLKALSMTAWKVRGRDNITALAEVKNLQHFKLQGSFYIDEEFRVAARSILLNSRSTLRSLVIRNFSHHTPGLRVGFLDNWQRELGSESQSPYFPALRSLQLIGLEGPDEGLMRTFDKAVNFMNLRSLNLERIYDGRSALYRHLADLAARTPNEDIKLRSFQMDHPSNLTLDQHRDDMETTCRFLSSFDCLTNLHVLEYNRYLAEGLDAEEPDLEGVLPDLLHRAILVHKNLTSLALHCRESDIRGKESYLSPEVIAIIVRVGEALARGKNLATISVTQIGERKSPTELVTEVLRGILDSIAGDSAENIPFRWENHSKLRRVITYRKRTFDMASCFREVKRDRKIQKPFRVCGLRNSEREVLCQDVTASLVAKDSQFVPDCGWAEDVARDMI